MVVWILRHIEIENSMFTNTVHGLVSAGRTIALSYVETQFFHQYFCFTLHAMQWRNQGNRGADFSK